ncbi:hypothetical protein LCGC14_1189440 [marine sediment metagenome]|uniref:Uncharacterized protein n=1 Tax=marine sediment metagenome TaxID=412755 RepID=A0A0F9M7M8_9ZZZZ
MTDILGTPNELSVTVGRTISDSNYGSFKVTATLTITLAPDANPKDSFDSVQGWLEANVGAAVKAQKKAYDLSLQLQPAQEEYGIGDERASPPPNFPETPDYTSQQSAHAPVKAPVASPAQPENVSGQMVTETWKRPTMTVEYTKGNDAYLLAKGGRWTEWGAPLWPEMIPPEWGFPEGWPERNEFNEKIAYGLPEGLQDVFVQMKPDGKPKKVIGFQ